MIPRRYLILGDVSVRDVEACLEELDGYEISTLLDVAGRDGEVVGTARLEVKRCAGEFVVRVSYEYRRGVKKGWCWSDKFVVRPLPAERGVVLEVARVGGVGRVRHALIAHLVARGVSRRGVPARVAEIPWRESKLS